MNQEYIVPNPWSIIEEGFDKTLVKSSESLFSIGNGAMGQRANFEEDYSGPTFQGSYIAGVYYPDKTRVGWWKNGYPEYFAKVINAPNWIGIKVKVNDETLDLNTCTSVKDFRRELNMKEGWYQRSFTATLQNGITISVKSTRILHLDIDELGVIAYEITPLNQDATIILEPYLDAGIENEDSNWDDQFWETMGVSEENHQAFIRSRTMKTHFGVCTYMESKIALDGIPQSLPYEVNHGNLSIGLTYTVDAKKGQTVSLHKYAGYTVSLNHSADSLEQAARNVLLKATNQGFESDDADLYFRAPGSRFDRVVNKPHMHGM